MVVVEGNMRAGTLGLSWHMVADRFDHMFVDRIRSLHHLRLLVRLRIAHQRHVDQRIPFHGHLEQHLDAGGDRQCEEGAGSTEYRAEEQDGEECDAGVQIHRTFRDLRRKHQILDLLVHGDEHDDANGVTDSALTPGEQHRQCATDIGSKSRDELRDNAAEQSQRQPVRHLDDHQEHRHAGRIDRGEDGTREQEPGNLILHHGPHHEEAALRSRSDPLAHAPAQLRAGDRDVERHHERCRQIQYLPKHPHRGAHRLTGEIGDPRSLDVLHDLAAKIVHLGQLEMGFRVHEGGELVV